MSRRSSATSSWKIGEVSVLSGSPSRAHPRLALRLRRLLLRALAHPQLATSLVSSLPTHRSLMPVSREAGARRTAPLFRDSACRTSLQGGCQRVSTGTRARVRLGPAHLPLAGRPTPVAASALADRDVIRTMGGSGPRRPALRSVLSGSSGLHDAGSLRSKGTVTATCLLTNLSSQAEYGLAV